MEAFALSSRPLTELTCTQGGWLIGGDDTEFHAGRDRDQAAPALQFRSALPFLSIDKTARAQGKQNPLPRAFWG